MIPVFANSAWVNGREWFLVRNGSWRVRRLQVRYGAFVHPSLGPVLIDTGYSPRILNDPGRGFWLQRYTSALAPDLNHEEQPAAILAKQGFSPEDVAVVIVTHFHADHISGLGEFRNAKFIGSGTAWAVVQTASAFQNVRHGIFPELLPEDFRHRFDPIEGKPVGHSASLPRGHDLFGDGTAIAVPLPGHAEGHFGVLFPKVDPPLLYATDAQWLIEALPRDARPRLLPRLISAEYTNVAESSDLVAAFCDAGGHVVLCHDDTPTPYDVGEGALL